MKVSNQFLARHVLLQDSGEFFHVRIVADDAAPNVENQDDSLSVFQEPFRELLLLVQRVLHARLFRYFLPPYMLLFVGVFDDGQIEIKQLVEGGDDIQQFSRRPCPLLADDRVHAAAHA